MDLSHPLEQLVGANTGRILRRLAMVSDELTGRRIAELSGVPVASAARELGELDRIGLVASKSVGSARLYRVNRDHVLWGPIEQIIAAPTRVEQVLAAAVTAHVGERATVATFGSFARGDAGPGSDVDLVIVWDLSVTEGEREATLDSVNREVAAATGNRVEVVELTENDLGHMIRRNDPLIASWERDGRTLAGPDFKTRLALVAIAAGTP